MSKSQAIQSSSHYVLSTHIVHIVSKVLAMVAERKEIAGMLTQLLGPTGSEITNPGVRKARH